MVFSCARNVAASTASISVARKPAFSSLCSAAIVVPPGEQTSSFNCPGIGGNESGRKIKTFICKITF
ncbi:hypothetical protein MAR_032485 [Mya arenaria]|uniref:Uncharacterized protein n=1 Tax=Mya arenaria TaxID=6604 RepID=A0ABY7FF60_MYAAR|nr:hypothetical protein MAR_032485 [Mya arenaria]